MRLVGLFALGFAAASSFAQSPDKDVKEWMDAAHIAGCQYAVYRDGKLVTTSGVGFADLENQVPVRPDSLFEIGSITKSFTAALIMQEVKAGTVNLDDPVTKYLPDLPKTWDAVTVRRALSHTAGLPEYLGIAIDIRKDYAPRDVIRWVEKEPLDFPPGMLWSYSNTGYILGGLILEKVTKKSWPDLIQERIFNPVGMKSGNVQDVMKVLPGRAHGYVYNGKAYQNADVLRPGAAYSAGAIVCDSADLAKYGDAVMREKLISHADLWKPIELNKGRTFDYGMGWFLRKVGDTQVVEHGGNTFGFSANLACYPASGLVVAACSNAAGVNLSGVTDAIARHYIKLEPAKPATPKPDPDKKRTYRLWDAFVSSISSKPDPTLVAEELIWQFKPTRMRTTRDTVKAAFLPLKSLIYVDERTIGPDTEITYDVVGKNRRARLKFLVDKEGKLVRYSS